MRMRRTVLAGHLAVFLGLVTSIAVGWCAAWLMRLPMYPRTILGSFVQWDTVWNISESKTWVSVDVWWMELGGEILEPTADGPIHQRLLAYLRAQQHSNEEILKEARRKHAALDADRDWVSVRNEPRPWGTFTLDEPPPERKRTGSDTAFGWPMPCLWYQVQSVPVQGTVFGGYDRIVKEELHGGWRIAGQPSSRMRDFRALPLKPIWTGLIINSLVFSVIWFMLLLAPGFIRRRLRHRRGCCMWCGYDLRGAVSERCPECGVDRQRQT